MRISEAESAIANGSITAAAMQDVVRSPHATCTPVRGRRAAATLDLQRETWLVVSRHVARLFAKHACCLKLCTTRVRTVGSQATPGADWRICGYDIEKSDRHKRVCTTTSREDDHSFTMMIVFKFKTSHRGFRGTVFL